MTSPSTTPSPSPGPNPGPGALPRLVQRASFVLGQALRLFFDLRARVPHRRIRALRRRPATPLILAANHEVILDPWLLLVACGYRTWSAMAPVHALGTQDWTGVYRRLRRLIFVLYKLYGVIRLPPRSRQLSREEKLAPVIEALRRGDVVGIFPEGHMRRPGEEPVRRFQHGVVLLHRRTGAPIVPIGLRVEPARRRRRFMAWVGDPVMIPAELDDTDAAEWLRTRIRTLYERARELR